MYSLKKRISAFLLAAAMCCGTPLSAAAEATPEFMFDSEDILANNLYAGQVIAAVNQSFGADSQVSGSFSSVSASEGSQSSLLDDEDAFDGGESGIYDIVTNPETGEPIGIRSLEFEDPVPSEAPPAEESADSAAEETTDYYVVGNTYRIVDDEGYYRPMECLYVGTYCTVWGSTGDNAKIRITSSIAKDIANEFDRNYTATVNAFGPGHDADGDGKLAIFCYDIGQESVRGLGSSYVGGFFRSLDMVSSSGYINGIYLGTSSYVGMGKDCIHLDTYPAMSSSSSPLGNVKRAYSTLIHEFQHLINFSYRVEGGTSSTYYGAMETYLNEAFSMAAEHLINGPSACTSRITYFNGENYVPGSPLTYWGSTLSNYANSYLFGQYLRTRYASQTGTNGAAIYKQILEARQQDNGQTDTLTMVAELLETTPYQLVMDFWAAVYLKDSSGNYGFNGESWADTISPTVYSSTSVSTSKIYNGGAKFYQIPSGGFTPSSKNNVAFICFGADGSAEISGAPSISNIRVTRDSESTATFSLTASKDGYIYYEVADYTITNTSELQQFATISEGVNTIRLTIPGGEAAEPVLYYFLAGADGTVSDLASLPVSAYTYPITVAASDRGSILLSVNTAPIDSGTRVRTGSIVTVDAVPNNGYVLGSLSLDGQVLDGNEFLVSGPHTVSAKFVYEDVAAADGFSSGSGTESDPFLITNVAELKHLANRVNAGDSMAGQYVRLDADLDLDGITVPIIGASDQIPFAGTFDGGRHTIANLSLDEIGTAYAALFGYLSGTVTALYLDNLKVQCTFAGGTGYAGGIAAYNTGTISFCNTEGTVRLSQFSTADAGGIAGYNAGTIANCRSEVSVSACDQSVAALFIHTGGIAGRNTATGIIESCEADGLIMSIQDSSLSTLTRTYAGGIVGHTAGTVRNCLSLGSVNASARAYLYLGGIAGYQGSGSVEGCYFYTPDGFFMPASTNTSFVGSLVGFQASAGTLQNSAATFKTLLVSSGTAPATNNIGYVVGYRAGSISNCYYNSSAKCYTTTSNDAICTAGTSTASANLLSKSYLSSTVGMDFEHTWEIGVKPDTDHPTLQSHKRLMGYLITVTGDASADYTYAYAGTTVTVSVPDETLYVKSLLVDGKSVSGDSFSVTGNHTVTAITAQKCVITAEDSSLGSISVVPYAKPGDSVTVSCTPNDGYSFVGLRVNGTLVTSDTFLVTEDSTVTGIFAAQAMTGSCGSSASWALIDQDDDKTAETLVLYGSGAMTDYTSFDSKLAPWISYRSQITTCLVSPGITTIGNNALYNCNWLTSVSIPATVTSIGHSAFNNCIRLAEVTLPYGVKSLGNSAFSTCTQLTSITLPDSITTLGSTVFYECTNLAEIILSANITEIGSYLFSDCTSLKRVVLPPRLADLETGFFLDCSSLESVVIPASVVSIGPGAFHGCSSLSDVYYAGTQAQWSAVTIDWSSYDNTPLTTATIHFIDGMDAVIPLTTEASDNGTIRVSGLLPYQMAEKGKTYTVSPATVSPGYQLTGLLVNGEEVKGTSFVAPAASKIVISGIFTKAYDVGVGGSCGASAYWALMDGDNDGINETLTIYGSGPMENYSSAASAPWNSYADQFTAVMVTDGITSIGNYAFSSCGNLLMTVLSSSVTSIGNNALNGCSALAYRYYLGTQAQWAAVSIAENNTPLTGTAPKFIQSVGDIVRIRSEQTSNGTFSVPAFALIGETVSVTLTSVNPGYAFKQLTINGSQTSSTLSFIVPSASSVTVSCEFIQQYEASVGGLCGDTVYWVLLDQDGNNKAETLVLYGSGEMANYKSQTTPWYSSRSNITTASVEAGITTLGSYAFYNLYYLTSVSLPDSMTSIGYGAFYDCSELTSILVPAGVTSIGDSAFYGCSGLKDITLPQGITAIPDSAFRGCYSLTYAPLTEQIETIGTYAFAACTGLVSVTIPASVTSMDSYAFSGCSALVSVTIPNSVTSIGSYAFQNCSSLVSVQLPESLAKINRNLFCDCSALSSLYIPSAVTSIDSYAFKYCDALTRVYYGGTEEQKAKISISHSNAPLTDAAWVCMGSSDDAIRVVIDPSDFGTFVLPGIVTPGDQVSAIPVSLTPGYELTGLTVNGVRMDSLTFTVPNAEQVTVSGIFTKLCDTTLGGTCGPGMFWALADQDGDGTEETLMIYGSGSMTSYNPNYDRDTPWYGYADQITTVIVEDGITALSTYAFARCTALTKVSLPDSVTEIGYGAFSGCSALPSIVLPAGLTAIEYILFSGCSALKTVGIPSGVLSIGDEAFSNCSSLTDLILPNGLTSIGEKAFLSCTTLKTLVLPDNLTTIEAYAFYSSGLTEIALPASITSLSNSVFGRSSLRSISFHDTLTSIGDEAFNYCSKLTDVYLIGTATDQSGITIGASNTKLTEATWHYMVLDENYIPFELSASEHGTIKVSGIPPYQRVKKGDEYTVSVTQVSVGYTFSGLMVNDTFVAGDTFKVPDADSVTITGVFAKTYNATAGGSCGTGVFWALDDTNNDGKGETLVIYGKGAMTDISYHPSRPWYDYHTSITSVIVEEGVTSVGRYAFYYCTNLKEVTLPDSLISIGRDAFGYCSSLTEVVLPDNVASIGQSAFSSCSALTRILLPGTITNIGAYAFSSCSKLKNVYYLGTEEDRASITIGTSNSYLTSATWHYVILTDQHVPVSVGTSDYGSIAIVDLPIYRQLEKGSTWSVKVLSALPGYRLQGLKVNDATVDGTTFTVPDAESLTVTPIFVKDREAEIGGLCGADAYWVLTDEDSDGVNETLTVYGNGSMSHYDTASKAPWNMYRSSITAFVAESGITHIGRYTLAKCPNLKNVSLPTTLSSIGYAAFSDCTGLANIQLPDQLTSVGEYAFNGCSALKCITFPNSVTSIGYAALWDCTSLTYAILPSGISTIPSTCFCACKALKTVVIPAGVTSIGSSAFKECSSLTGIVLPDGVTSIGSSAFYKCQKLETVVLPKGLTTINSDAFRYSGISTVYYAGTETDRNGISILCSTIKNADWIYSFNATGLVPVIADDSITIPSLPAYQAFEKGSIVQVNAASADPGYQLTGLVVNGTFVTGTSFTVPDASYVSVSGVFTKVYDAELGGLCGANTYWALTDSDSDGTSETLTIYGTGTMDSVSSSGNIPWYDHMSSITTLVVDEGVQSISRYALHYCRSLTSASIASTVTEIGDSAFYYCKNLTSLSLAGSVTTIGADAFDSCSGLTYVILGPEVATIGADAFGYCSALKDIYYVGTEDDRAAISIDATNTALLSATWHYMGSASDLVPLTLNSVSEGVVSIPGLPVHQLVVKGADWTVVPTSALPGYQFTGLLVNGEPVDGSTFTVPDSDSAEITPVFTKQYDAEIGGLCGESTYWVLLDQDDDDTAETLVLYGSGEMSQAYGAGTAPWYPYHEAITSAVVSTGITAISDCAFYDCSSLKDVSIPAGVTSIGRIAFSGCSSLERITIPNGVTAIADGTFSGCSKLVSIEIPETVASIGSSAFANCISLDHVVLPKNLTSIEPRVFYNCRTLTNLVIPEGVTSIGEYACFSCTKLAAVVVPKSVTTIDSHAFAYCTLLTEVDYRGTEATWATIATGQENSPLLAAERYYVGDSELATLVITQPEHGFITPRTFIAKGVEFVPELTPEFGYAVSHFIVNSERVSSTSFIAPSTDTVTLSAELTLLDTQAILSESDTAYTISVGQFISQSSNCYLSIYDTDGKLLLLKHRTLFQNAKHAFTLQKSDVPLDAATLKVFMLGNAYQPLDRLFEFHLP